MRMKSYFTDSLEGAMERARVELGPDAMLISSRRTGIDLKDLGAYEVVFGWAEAGHSSGVSGAAEAVEANEPRVWQELQTLRRQLENLSHSMNRSNLSKSTEGFAPELSRLLDRLQAAGFSPNIAHEVTAAAGTRLRGSARDGFARDLFYAVVNEELASRFAVSPTLGTEGAASVGVLLVGPPGGGKTSSLMKLGLQQGLRAGKPLRVLSIDTLRMAACEPLRRFANISGAEFREIADAAELKAVLEERSHRGLTLVDTAGYGRAEEADIDDLAHFAQALPLEIHLVIPATLQSETMRQACRRFAVLKPAKLLLTHLDEIETPAAAIEAAMLSGLPLSFLGTGQQVPDDLQLASQSELIGSLALQERAVSVAA